MASIHDILKAKKNSFSDTASLLENKVSSLVDDINQIRSDNNRNYREITKNAEILSNRITLTYDELIEKINSLESSLEQIKNENCELRKKLENLINIKEDSEKLNSEDNSEKELIQVSYKNVKQVTYSPNNINYYLDSEQQRIFSAMRRADKNMFITGRAGTGKSFLLKQFVKLIKKRTLVVAPTGLAAMNIGGATIHSVFGYDNLERIPINSLNNINIKLSSDSRVLIKSLEVLIIDEISMVSSEMFDKIDRIMRIVCEADIPFGGKTVFVFGDLCQLPPVVSFHEAQYLYHKYGGIYFFNSNAYRDGSFVTEELTRNHRQVKDNVFFNILGDIRNGEISREDIDLLNTRYKENEKIGRITRLYAHRNKADEVNISELNKINAKEFVFNAEIIFQAHEFDYSYIDKNLPINSVLKLKLGALVMMVKNDEAKRWVNGTLGIVSGISDQKIKVTINGYEYEVKKQTFEMDEARYVNNCIEYEKVIEVQQFPCVLAYAISIHKSQGMTYKQIACDISGCFVGGQAYVALSRCESLDGLHLINKVTGNEIEVNQEVLNFYKKNNTESSVNLVKKSIDRLNNATSPSVGASVSYRRIYKNSNEKEVKINSKVLIKFDDDSLVRKFLIKSVFYNYKPQLTGGCETNAAYKTEIDSPADPNNGIITDQSPLGKAIIGKKKGDRFSYQVNDDEINGRIIDVE